MIKMTLILTKVFLKKLILQLIREFAKYIYNQINLIEQFGLILVFVD